MANFNKENDNESSRFGGVPCYYEINRDKPILDTSGYVWMCTVW